MNAMLVTALLLGAAGSAHCIGMCGPIALAVPSWGRSVGARWMSTLLLNGGRLFTYALLGLAFGMMGMGLRLAGLQQVLSLVLGALLLLAVAVPGMLSRWDPSGKAVARLGRLRSALAKNLKRTAPEAIFLTGLLNGLLPCGLVYAALVGSAAMESVAGSVLFMVLFALGTWPALFAVRLSSSLLGARGRSLLRKAAPIAMAVMGGLLVMRGLGLGIPYLSPDLPFAPMRAAACP